MTYKSREDRNGVIESNLPLVTSRVKKINNGVFDDDLFQEGVIGLIQATDRYDESRGFTFSTYAVSYIDGYIKKYKNVNQTVKPIRGKDGLKYASIVSLDDFNVDIGLTFGASIPDDVNMEEKIISNVVVENFLKRMRPKERQVIDNILSHNMTQKEISKTVGISRTTVNNIKKKLREQYIKDWY